MLILKKVGEFYSEFWLEDAERALIGRMLGVKSDNVIMIVTVITKGIDTHDLRTEITSNREPIHDETNDLFAECDRHNC